MTTFTSGSSALIARVAWSPLHGDMPTSIRTSSGFNRRVSSTASLPSAACPTTSIPQALRRLAIPARKRAWSSARSTRTHGLPCLCGHVNRNTRALSRSREDVESATDSLRPLAHRLEPQAGPPRPVEHQRIEAVAVIHDLDAHSVFIRVDDHVDAGRSCVLAHVAQRLLDDPDELDLGGRDELHVLHVVVHPQLDLAALHTRQASQVLTNRRHESSGRRSESHDRLADVVVYLARDGARRLAELS